MVKEAKRVAGLARVQLAAAKCIGKDGAKLFGKAGKCERKDKANFAGGKSSTTKKLHKVRQAR